MLKIISSVVAWYTISPMLAFFGLLCKNNYFTMNMGDFLIATNFELNGNYFEYFSWIELENGSTQRENSVWTIQWLTLYITKHWLILTKILWKTEEIKRCFSFFLEFKNKAFLEVFKKNSSKVRQKQTNVLYEISNANQTYIYEISSFLDFFLNSNLSGKRDNCNSRLCLKKASACQRICRIDGTFTYLIELCDLKACTFGLTWIVETKSLTSIWPKSLCKNKFKWTQMLIAFASNESFSKGQTSHNRAGGIPQYKMKETIKSLSIDFISVLRWKFI